MKKMTTRFLVTITLTLGSSMISLHAQNYFLSKTKLTIVGNAQIDFTSDTSQSQFGNLAFKPVFLVSLSDRLFLESELEVATSPEGVELVLEYAHMVYFVNQHFTRPLR